MNACAQFLMIIKSNTITKLHSKGFWIIWISVIFEWCVSQDRSNQFPSQFFVSKKVNPEVKLNWIGKNDQITTIFFYLFTASDTQKNLLVPNVLFWSQNKEKKEWERKEVGYFRLVIMWCREREQCKDTDCSKNKAERLCVCVYIFLWHWSCE